MTIRNRILKVLLSEHQRTELESAGCLSLHREINPSPVWELADPSQIHMTGVYVSQSRVWKHQGTAGATPCPVKSLYRFGQILAVMEEVELDFGRKCLIYSDGNIRPILNEQWLATFSDDANRRLDPILLPFWGIRLWMEVSSCVPQYIDGVWNWVTTVQKIPSPVKPTPRSCYKMMVSAELS